MGTVEEKVELNGSQGQKFRAFCASCKADTNHEAIQTVDVSGSEVIQYGPSYNDRDSVDWINRYQVVKCLGCDTFSFCHRNWFSEAAGHYGPEGYDDGTTVRLYPQRGKDVLVARDFYNVPRNLRGIYKEVISCFNNDSPMLCAVGLRASIEGLCAANGVTDGPVEVQKSDGSVEIKRKRNLEGKISGLSEKGLLTKKNAELLHEHRYIGNDAVHELSRPSDADLKTAIEIVEHMFESLYEIPEKAEALKVARVNKRMTDMP
ncbi:hypothetical protein NIPOLPBK_02765 [Stenotrophomonas maltophilia]|uniref:DUF4145 domain-containing protein n=1 Tax=Stenotrophomonas maltophilia TaxID=40324 RepID=UPI0012B0026D|nr:MULTISPECIES: DUF4145 domain-containing protein [Stenotrophomonas]MBC9116300.1 DUF4145 domain-containing protein [Stenotrophomonas maltophilia]MCR1806279.1 DUF4145 domain-containing protein [Stenotrophomonas geniculata]QGL71673.1 DUF4145 domain-containing protein [Stenotrophomonas maltophilia]QNG69550.1 hypothetical protein NIPOLPBK_02765 [Stenotrophomonas maltophilia]WBL68040.1 hypothetical protein SMAL454_18740 [Stenotrophomonas maltophilia]